MAIQGRVAAAAALGHDAPSSLEVEGDSRGRRDGRGGTAQRPEAGAGRSDGATDWPGERGLRAVEPRGHPAQDQAGQLSSGQRVGHTRRHGVVDGRPGQAEASARQRRRWHRSLPAPVGEGCRRVEMLEDEVAPLERRCLRHRSGAQVEVQGAHHVDAGGVVEQAELRADAWIEIEQLVAPVAPVEAPVEIGDPAVADRRAEAHRERPELLVACRAAARRHPGVGRP